MASPDPRLLDVLHRWIDRGRPDGRPPLIGVTGCQGSGKTTLCRVAAERSGAANFSIDDVYLTFAERTERTRALGPLFGVRGPPGTHDLDLARRTIASLQSAGPAARTPLPSFDKIADDRRPQADWPVFEGRPSAVLIDSWCLGATPEPEARLARPVNALERDEDPDLRWRRAVNAGLAGPYAAFTAGFDAILFLRAPGFEVVMDWRTQQDADLYAIPVEAVTPRRRAEIDRFIQHYERVTRQMLNGGIVADLVVDLGPRREIVDIREVERASG